MGLSVSLPQLKFTRKYRRQGSEVADVHLSRIHIPTKETSEVIIRRDPEGGNKLVNQYCVMRTIGVGAYGKVKLVLNLEDNQLYAMKILIKSQLKRKRIGMKKGSAFEDCLREIELMKKMDSLYAIKLIEILDDPNDDKLYMILEYAEGGPTMKSEMELDPLPEDKARLFFHDIVCAIDYIHSMKIIHRDIKPENLLVTSDGRVKISDFSVSINLDSKEDQKLLKKTAGSPIFIPPELCGPDNCRIIGTALDVWSLGITLHFFLFGRPPFQGDTEMQLYDNIRNQRLTFENLTVLAPDGIHLPVSKELQDLLRRILHKDPKHRITIKEIKKHPWVKFDQISAQINGGSGGGSIRGSLVNQ